MKEVGFFFWRGGGGGGGGEISTSLGALWLNIFSNQMYNEYMHGFSITLRKKNDRQNWQLLKLHNWRSSLQTDKQYNKFNKYKTDI